MLFDEEAARLYFFAHQHRKHMVGGDRIGQGDPYERSARRIHRGIAELICVHLAKTFIALDFDTFAAIDSHGVDQFFQGIDFSRFPPSSRRSKSIPAAIKY